MVADANLTKRRATEFRCVAGWQACRDVPETGCPKYGRFATRHVSAQLLRRGAPASADREIAPVTMAAGFSLVADGRQSGSHPLYRVVAKPECMVRRRIAS